MPTSGTVAVPRRSRVTFGHVNLSRPTDLITTGIGCHSTKPTEISMLKCYDSVTDGSVSRWSFHRACIDPTAPDDAPCRRNLVVRSYVFF